MRTLRRSREYNTTQTVDDVAGIFGHGTLARGATGYEIAAGNRPQITRVKKGLDVERAPLSRTEVNVMPGANASRSVVLARSGNNPGQWDVAGFGDEETRAVVSGAAAEGKSMLTVAILLGIGAYLALKA